MMRLTPNGLDVSSSIRFKRASATFCCVPANVIWPRAPASDTAAVSSGPLMLPMAALLHAVEPDMTRIVRSGLEADAIIDDPKFDVLAVGYQLHFDRPRRRMLDHILYGFLGNPI